MGNAEYMGSFCQARMEDTVCDSVSSDDLSQFAPVQFSTYVDPNGVTDNQGRNIGTIPQSFYPSVAEPYPRIPPDHSNQEERKPSQMYEQPSGMYYPQQQQRPPTDPGRQQGERGYSSGHPPPSAHPEPKRN